MPKKVEHTGTDSVPFSKSNSALNSQGVEQVRHSLPYVTAAVVVVEGAAVVGAEVAAGDFPRAAGTKWPLQSADSLI